MSVFNHPLMVITSSSLNKKTLLSHVHACLDAGVSCIQYRDKSHRTQQRLDTAASLQELTKAYQATFIINDDVQLALELDACGVHLGQSDMPIHEARALLKPEQLIGLSIENIQQALAHQNSSVDYFGVGPIFATLSKQDAAPPIGIEGLQQIAKILQPKPIIAIGGITLHNAKTILHHGANSLAVISAIMHSDNVFSTTQKFLRNCHEAL